MGLLSVGFTRKVPSEQIQKAERERVRREECHRVKHDKLFSDWKILVGSSDWKSHAAEEEGSQRYQLHNLPKTYLGPGVYELGLTLQNLSAGARKIRKQNVIVVYLGQAENVRHRLQTYGQSGSHLEGVRLATRSVVEQCEYDDGRNPLSVQRARAKSDGSTNGGTERGLRLFTEVFSRGYSIVFRWAKTESKQMAEKVEAELLHVFDYPWNRGLNGARRPDDILARLELMQYHLKKSLCLGSILTASVEIFHRKVGIKVRVKKPSEEERSESTTSRFSVFRTSSKDGLPGDGGSKSGNPCCGASLKDGSSCRRSPVKGRRRCSDHKGLRVKLTTRRARIVKPKVAESGDKVNSHSNGDNFNGGSNNPPVLVVRSTPNGKRLEFGDSPGDGVVCGITLGDGNLCSNIPLKGRKRCASHKGMHAKSSGIPVTIDRPNLRGTPTQARKPIQRHWETEV